MLNYRAFFSFENGHHVNTGLGVGAEKEAGILSELMQDYGDIPFIKDNDSFDMTPCPKRNTRIFLENGLVQDDSKQVINDNILILPTLFLCPIDFITGELTLSKDTISIHWFSASWRDNLKYDTIVAKRKIQKKIQKRKNIMDRLIHLPNCILLNIFGETRYNRIKSFFGKL